ncbi:hypothetical protein [Sporosarcina sp. NPDC096371]|uniref:hypothetical protein n=1 Tax=Sporosarcina sp. NPDC096371 TaxID=3364530 RepID=UPI003830D4B2
MRRSILFFVCVALLTACSDNDKTKTTASSETERAETVEGNTEATKDTVRHADFQAVLPTEWQVTLPIMYPVEEGKYVTAKTMVTADEVTYDFYEFDGEVALDDAKVEEGTYIGQLMVTKFEDEFAADEALKTSLTINDNYVDIGSFLVYPFTEGEASVVNWNDNQGWTIFVRSMEKSPTELVEWIEGGNVVPDLSEGVLNGQYPRPQILGQMHFNEDDQAKTYVTWAANEIVYTLKDFEDHTLEWLGAFGESK